MNAMFIIQGRGYMAVLSTFLAVLLYHGAMHTWKDCSVVNTGQRGNDFSDCSYCSTVTANFYGYLD